MRQIGLTLGFLLLLGVIASADVIHLKNGRKVEGRIIEDGFSYVRVETEKGVVEIDRDDIEKIEEKAWKPPKKAKKKKKPSRRSKKKEGPVPSKVWLPMAYRDGIRNFRLRLPQGWNGARSTPALHTFLGQSRGGPAPRIDLKIEHSDLPLAEYAPKAGKSSDLKLGEQAAVRMETEEAGRRVLRQVLDEGARKFTMTFSAPADAFEKQRDAVESIFNSLRVFPEHKLNEEQEKAYRDLYDEAHSTLEAQEFTKALPLYEKLGKMVPNSPEVPALIGTAYTQMRKWKKASEYYKKAVEADPDSFDYNYFLSAVLTGARKLRDATKYAELATEIDPFAPQGWANLGFVFLHRAKYKDAEAAYRNVVELHPSAEAHFNLGVVYEYQRKLADAKKQYKEALKKNPGFGPAKQALGRLK